jgi:hypothetical protein
MPVRDHAPALYKAADVIRGKPADNIGGFINHRRVIAHGDLAARTLFTSRILKT